MACLLCRPPPPPLACFSAPIPRPPSRREGGDQGYFMQGASPLASPASDCLRHLQSLPYRCTCGRALSFSSANPALSFGSAPIPPSPFPAGRGRPRLFYARGEAPCIPGLNPRGTGSTCRCRRLNGGVPPALLARRALAVPGGGFPSLSPAAPAFSLLFCPHPPCPPSRREGGDFRLFYARGFAPCIPGAEGTRHWLDLPSLSPAGGLCLLRGGVEVAFRYPAGGFAFFAACQPCL